MAWSPLEADPEILTQFIQGAGVPKDYQIVDVFGLDDDLLATLPEPLKAFILLFPVTKKYEEHRLAENEELVAKGWDAPEGIFFMKQVIANACGTIALIHAVANNDIPLAPGILQTFLEGCEGKDSEKRADFLGQVAAFATAHEEVAQAGLTAVPDNVLYHFIALVNFKGTLYELDGRKAFPIAHGPVKEGELAKECARVCKEFMARDPDNVNFNIMALTGV